MHSHYAIFCPKNIAACRQKLDFGTTNVKNSFKQWF